MMKKTTKKERPLKSPHAREEGQKGRKPRRIDFAKLASILMLATAVIFNLYNTTAVLSYGVNDSGDDQYHLSQSYDMKKLIIEEHTIFGVVYAYGLGYPWFNTHQWLMYASEVALNLVTFDYISLLDAHKILLVLYFSLFPLGVYYMLGKFKQAPIVCGLGALLAPTIISGWGHTTTAYFVIGLTSQAAAGFLFPFALGSFHQLITEGTGPRKTALLYVFTTFAHPYYGYFLGYMSVIDILIQAWRKNPTQILTMIKYGFFATVIGLLLAAFWIVPLPEAMKYAPRTLDLQAVKGGFTIDRAVKEFTSGGLLDVSNNFGDPGDKNLRWPINTGRGRLPILTALTLVGLAYSVYRRDRFAAFCLVGFALAFVFIIGSDDITALKYLPFAERANAKRAIYLLELFVICLSAASLNMILSSVRSVVGRMSGIRVGEVASVLVLFLVIYTPYNERMLTTEREVNTLSYWFQKFDAMKDVIKRDGSRGNMYGDGETGIISAPLILSQPWLLDTPYMRRLYVTRFWGDLYDYPNTMRLFNIRYILTGNTKEIPENVKPIFTSISTQRPYVLYRVEGDFGYSDISHKKPALITSTEEGWRVISEVWLHYYKNSTQADYLPYIVEYQGQKVNGDDYSQLMEYDDEATQQLNTIFSGRIGTYNSSDLRHNLIRAAIKNSKNDTAKDEITAISHTQSRFMAMVDTDKEGLMTYKVTYHPNWKASIDGKDAEVVRASPEFPAIFVKPGKHIVEFRYEQSTLQQALNVVSILTLIFVLLPTAALNKAAASIKALLGPTNPA